MYELSVVVRVVVLFMVRYWVGSSLVVVIWKWLLK